MKSFIRIADRILVRYTPDPFVIAIALSWLTVFLAVQYTDSTVLETVDAWGNGFWNLATFTLQMVMTLLGGYVVATSPLVQSFLRRQVARLRTPVQGVVFCTLAALVASWVSWGLGLVVGALAALETSRRLPGAPFRVLVASSYTGFLVWHGGLSGSIPLAVNTADNFSLEWTGGETIPLSATLLGPVNLIALAGLVVLLPVLNVILLRGVTGSGQPSEGVALIPPGDGGDGLAMDGDDGDLDDGEDRPLFLERTFWMAGVLVGLAVIYLAGQVVRGEFSLNLKSLTLILFMAGLALHGSPRKFSMSVAEATPKIAPILIQYPLYAAMMGVLVETGLAARVSEWFVSVSSRETFPLMTFYSAGLINLFVPSGGGQWSVQAPIVLPAAQALGADVPRTVMAVAWGDAWTNMAQPFWAVPLLAIAGLRIRDIIGLCLVVLVASGVWLSLVFRFV